MSKIIHIEAALNLIDEDGEAVRDVQTFREEFTRAEFEDASEGNLPAWLIKKFNLYPGETFEILTLEAI